MNFSKRLPEAMVMNGEAAFQIMGDWAKGEFLYDYDFLHQHLVKVFYIM